MEYGFEVCKSMPNGKSFVICVDLNPHGGRFGMFTSNILKGNRYYMYGHTYSKSMDQPGKVTNPARGQLNRKMNISRSPFAPENLVSRDGSSSPVPRQPVHLHTQAESGSNLRDSSQVPRRHSFIYLNRHTPSGGSVPSLSGHAIAYRWRSLPRVRLLRTSKPQGSSKRVLPWQVIMDQIICTSLSHIHYIGMKWELYWKYVKLLWLFFVRQ